MPAAVAAGVLLIVLPIAFNAAFVLLAKTFDYPDILRRPGATVGVLAATVQFLGLVRWPFLVPYLARQMDDTASSPTRKEAIDVVFQSFHRYLGVAVGKHLGYLFTGAWSVLVGAAMIQAPAGPKGGIRRGPNTHTVAA
ncbi:DUF4386 family protein [Mycetocola miduiensis]|uniref:Uncharacterized protein n=1 Tax=Mycetocola miduiensis TaxID=995034 RepID=A0A1I5ACK3_9MICO|nr:DUF4386 family protein [Mycetocola miduiensis]SFN60177.1 protein of unknown function [Mycetocola miduiensis]